ncbi:MAG TPA: type 4a pilus biogenesis protein PilO [Patescibacteria group bacterium]|jgi:Tfp pilus assembly protein PilO
MAGRPIINLSGKYNTIAAVVGVALLVSVLVAAFLVRPAWSRLQELGKEIPVEQQKRDLAKQDLENLKAAKSFFDEKSDDVETVNSALPIEPDVPSILLILEGLAVDSGVQLDGFTPQQIGVESGVAQQQNKPTGVDSLEITANFSGRYPQLITFLYGLERSLRLVDVRVINVNAVKGSSSDPVIAGNISFTAYYRTVEGGPKPSTGGTQQQPQQQGAAPAAPPPGGSN